jgi:DNA replication protein DnaC
MLEQVYGIVDARYRPGKPLIVTTNIPIDDIKKPVDLRLQRIYDRIIEMCHPVEVKGQSRRRLAVADEYATHNKMLGLE